MEWYEAEVRELVARLAAYSVPVPVVAYGSSSMRLWSTLASDLRIPGIVNAAFGGSTLEACVHFFDRIIAPLEPQALLVYAGDNDLGDGRPVDAVLESFHALQAKLDRVCGNIPFGFLSIKPSPARASIADKIRQTNALIQSEIERRPNGFFVALYDAMLLDEQPRSDLYLEDGLHLSVAGYAVWARLLRPYRERLVPPHPPADADEPAVS